MANPTNKPTEPSGRYAYDATVAGTYRLRYHDEHGPAVRVS